MVKYMHAFTVGALHELIGLPEHGELELCERLEKEELVHLRQIYACTVCQESNATPANVREGGRGGSAGHTAAAA